MTVFLPNSILQLMKALFDTSTVKKVPVSGTAHSLPPVESLSVGIDSVCFYHPKHAAESFQVRILNQDVPFQELLLIESIPGFEGLFIFERWNELEEFEGLCEENVSKGSPT